MPNPTSNFGWNKPTVGGDSNAWGGYLNGNLDALDGTLGALLSPTGNLVTGGGVSVSKAGWGTNGLRAVFVGATYTDISSNGTVTAVYIDAHKAAVIASSNTVTYTNAYGAYFENPVAGSNVTLTNRWALGADTLQVNGVGTIAGAASLGSVAVVNNATVGGNLTVAGSATTGKLQASGVNTGSFAQSGAITGTFYNVAGLTSAAITAASPGKWDVMVISQNVQPALFRIMTATNVSPTIFLDQVRAGTNISGQLDGSGNFQVAQTSGSTQTITVLWVRDGL